MPREAFATIVEKLLKLSRADKVRWDANRGHADYGVTFPESSLTITHFAPQTEPDYYEIELWDRDMLGVGGVTIIPSDVLWEQTRALYEDASRCTTGWDGVLADISRTLDAGERVGWFARPTISYPEGDDDIPF